MKTSLRNRLVHIALALATALPLALTPATALAYDMSKYKVAPEEGSLYIDNRVIEGGANVNMYVLVQKEYADEDVQFGYSFWCDEGVFDFGNGAIDDSNNIIYNFRMWNKKIIDIIPDVGEVWLERFTLEPGTYEFANPEGLDGISVLTSSLGSYRYDDGYTKSELTKVEAGDSIILYAAAGDFEWRDQEETVSVLMEYAKEMDAKQHNGDPNWERLGDETTEIEEAEETEDKEVTIENALEKENKEPAIETETSIDNNKESTKEISQNVETEKENVEGKGHFSIKKVILFAFAIVAAGYLFAAIKRRF